MVIHVRKTAGPSHPLYSNYLVHPIGGLMFKAASSMLRGRIKYDVE